MLADRVQVQQILVNLIRNAREAMLQSARRELTVETRTLGPGSVEIAVSDTGPGIAEEVADRLFQPFVTTKPGGMGMGLSICRTAIEFHGGTLSYRPHPEGGTIFSFTLPDPTKNNGDNHAAYRRRRGGDS